jgi:hypothetical protein
LHPATLDGGPFPKKENHRKTKFTIMSAKPFVVRCVSMGTGQSKKWRVTKAVIRQLLEIGVVKPVNNRVYKMQPWIVSDSLPTTKLPTAAMMLRARYQTPIVNAQVARALTSFLNRGYFKLNTAA